MKHVLIVDDNQGFLSDVEARCFLDGISGVESANSLDDAFKKSDNDDFDEVVVGGNMLGEIERDSFRAPVSAYARKAEDIVCAEEKGIPSYGIVKNSGVLIDAINKGNFVSVVHEDRPAGKAETYDEPEFYDDEEDADDDIFRRDYDNGRVINRNERRGGRGNEPRDTGASQTASKSSSRNAEAAPSGTQRAREARPVRETRSVREARPVREQERDITEENNDILNDAPKARAEEPEVRQAARGLRASVLEKKTSDSDAEFEVNRDMGNIKDPAKVVTVFSAKGGVGKTTVSCELATFLALSAHGRDRLKVCLVDFNVDFGDVLNTLALNPKHKGMTSWSSRIKEDLERLPGDHSQGYSDDELDHLYYSAADVNEWLQEVPESGLSVLIAPTSNEDSMSLMEDGEDVHVILNNLINNSEFDYIICDTGNNTRNSSFIPLEMADYILMIVTQSVNTANCNASFLSTLKTVGFDTKPIKIIVNRARSKKLTGIAVDELLEVMTDPTTGRPFECAGIIKETGDVEVMGNRGVPIAYDPSNPFTKSIAEIARCVNEETFTLEKPEKQGFFARRRKNRG